MVLEWADAATSNSSSSSSRYAQCVATRSIHEMEEVCASMIATSRPFLAHQLIRAQPATDPNYYTCVAIKFSSVLKSNRSETYARCNNTFEQNINVHETP